MKKFVAGCVISILVLPFLAACQVVETTQTATTRKRPNFDFSGTADRTSTLTTIAGVCEFNNLGGTITLSGDFIESPLDIECDAEDEVFSTLVIMDGPEEVKTIRAEYQTYEFSTEIELDTTPPDNMTGISPAHQSIRYNNETTLAQTEVDLRVPCEFGGTDVEILGDFLESPLELACTSSEQVRATINLNNSNYSNAQGENTISINQEDDVGNASNETLTLYVPLNFYVSASFGDDATAVWGDEELPWLTVSAALSEAETYISSLTLPSDEVQETLSDPEALAILNLDIGTYSGLTLTADWDPLIHIHGRSSDRDQTILGGINAYGAEVTDDNAFDTVCPAAPLDGFNVVIRSNGLVNLGNIDTRGGGWGSKADGECVAGYAAGAGGNVYLSHAYSTGFIYTYSGYGGDSTGSPGAVYLSNSNVTAIYANSDSTEANGVVAAPSNPPPAGNITIVNNSSVNSIFSVGDENAVDGTGSTGGDVVVSSSWAGNIQADGGGTVLGASGGSVTINESSYIAGTVSATGGAAASGGTILVSDFSFAVTLNADGGTDGNGGTVTVTDNSIASIVTVNSGGGTGGVGGTVEISDFSEVAAVGAIGGTDGAGGTINLLNGSEVTGSLDASAGAGDSAIGGTVNISASTVANDVYALGSTSAVTNGAGGAVTLDLDSEVGGDVDVSAGAGAGTAGAAGTVNIIDADSQIIGATIGI